MGETIYALGTRETNGELIADAHDLGYIPGRVLDTTIGPDAGFWTKHRPDELVTNDINPSVEADFHHDIRDGLPFDDRSFDTVVFDPPYRMSGTRKGTSASVLDERYGLDGEYEPASVIYDRFERGTLESLRLAGQFVLVKCMDQISSGSYQPQTFFVWRTATTAGAILVDHLLVVSNHPRSQPAGRRQVHARREYSSLLVFRAPR